MIQEIETRTIAKVTWRLLPFLIVCYFAAYLDRVNVGFAALTMNKALGISSTAFGFGAGIFFIAYFVFEVPSNLALERFGARKWIARIMFSWGLLSGLMAFIPHLALASGLSNTTLFYTVRVLLGAAEAGFFPGIIFYLTLWFPSVYRARIIGFFMAAIPLSSVIGAPVSGIILATTNGLGGLEGWQWLFILEAVPALLLTFGVLYYLTDRPNEATWLTREERTWLVARLTSEQRQREAVQNFSVKDALFDPKVLALAVVYFGAVATNYGLSFFLPQIVKAFGMGNIAVGFVTAIPFVVGTVSMVLWGLSSDRTRERKGHVAFALFVAAAGITIASLIDDPTFKMICLGIAGFGIFASLPVFWTLPTAFLSGPAAAGGIAIINSIGNLSGFAGPFAMGWIHDETGSYTGGMLAISTCAVIGMVVVALLRHDRGLERAPSKVAAE